MLALSASIPILCRAYQSRMADRSARELANVEATEQVLSEIQTSPDETERRRLWGESSPMEAQCWCRLMSFGNMLMLSAIVEVEKPACSLSHY